MALLYNLVGVVSIIAIAGLVSALGAIPGHLFTRNAVYGTILLAGSIVFIAAMVVCLIIYLMMGHKSLQAS
jgi:putative copper export protein